MKIAWFPVMALLAFAPGWAAGQEIPQKFAPEQIGPRTQIDGISALVNVVEGHLKQTQANIATTATHVNEIDAVRNALK